MSWVDSQNYIFDSFYIPDRDPPNKFNYTKLQQPGVSSEFLDRQMEYYNNYGSKLYPSIVSNN